MKLAFFDDFKLGVVAGDKVVDVTDVVKDIPRLGPQDVMRGVIERFDALKDRLVDAAAKGHGKPVSQVRLRPPLLKPENIICMAVNYMEDGTLPEPAPMNAFMKSPSAIIGDGDTMILPDMAATIFEGEAELAVVIGKRASHVKAADAKSYVFGYTNFIDGSARGVVPPTNVFYQMKSRDTFAPIGPYIVTADEIKDPHKLQIRLTNRSCRISTLTTWRIRFRAALNGSPRFTRCTPATFSQPAPTIEGSIRSWTATISSSPVRAAARCTSQCVMI